MGRRPDAWRRVSSRDHDVWDRVLTASDELRRNRVAVWPDTGNSSEAALRVSLTTWGQPDLENLVLTWLPDSGAAYRQLALRLGLEVVGSLGSAPRTT